MDTPKKKKGIKSGTLRNTYNDALNNRIVCRNQILITLAAMESEDYKSLYSSEQKLSITKVLLKNGYEKDFILKYIRMIIPQITDEYFPTKAQINRFLDTVSGDYTYREGYIKDILLKSVDFEDLTQSKKKKRVKKRFNAQELKRYICDNQKLEFILEELGCTNISYDQFKNKYKCSNPDGDKIGAIEVKDDYYMGVKNYTRSGYDDRADIFTLVMNIRGLAFSDAITYLHSLLGLVDIDLSEFEFESNEKEDSDVSKKDVDEPKLRVYSESLLNREYFYNFMDKSWYEEGITEEARAKFGIKLSCAKVFSQRGTVIPLRHYETGALLGISLRRSMDDEEREVFGIPKYDVTKGYPKSRNIYGLWENRESIIECGYCIVYEAEKAVLQRFSLGDDTGVAIQGHSLSDKQATILKELDVDIILSMDSDIDLEEVRGLCEILYRKGVKRIFYTYDFEGLLNDKESIADRPEVFDRIFNNKVLYGEKEHQAYKDSLKH